MTETASARTRSAEPGEAARGGFTGYRAANRGAFAVDFPVDTVFPLFGAEKETRWDPSFQPAWIFPETAVATERDPEQGWVFLTDPGAREERLWHVERFDTVAHEAVYVVHWPGHMIYRIAIASAPAGGAGAATTGTLTDVTYEFVGLSDEGNRQVRERTHDPARFADEMKQWARMITDCLGRAGE